uniref:Phosphatidic acid phosphatase type 2/haloperoxidase domain-containing protein n=1 Tax=Stomoxys calcitrans TaxID=35570 RepID=A0A1I8NZW2_STOCA
MCKFALKYLLRLLFDFVIIAVLLVLSLKTYLFLGAPTRRGFFCGDESLMYPFHEDTINSHMLQILSFGIPLLVIVVCGLLENLALQKRSVGTHLRTLLTIHDSLLPFLFGYAAVRLIKDVGKVTVGRLRPYFFEVCHPVHEDVPICDDDRNYGIYIEEYECVGSMGDTEGAVHTSIVENIMRSSFPSGHAALAFFGMSFTVFYLQRFSSILRRSCANVGLVMPLLQFVCILVAWFVATSRVLDYKHHWSDVVAGGFLGLGVGIAVAYYVHGHLKGSGTFLEVVDTPKVSITRHNNRGISERSSVYASTSSSNAQNNSVTKQISKA